MKQIALSTTLYSFDELDKNSQRQAINDHIKFLLECYDEDVGLSENFNKAVKRCEEMQTPWFIREYIDDYCKAEIIDELREDTYWFDNEGKYAPITYRIDGDNTTVWYNETEITDQMQ